MKFTFALLFLLIFKISPLSAQCTEQLLLNGQENIVEYGMDTTRHWWAVTEPFTKRFRLTVDTMQTDVYTQIFAPVFSPDGNKWATFGFENLQWFLVTNDTVRFINSTEPQQIFFSADSRVVGIAFRQETEDMIRFGDREIRTMNRTGNVFISPGGERVAYTVQRGGQTSLFVDRTEIVIAEEIKPIGFWNDGDFLYATRSGKQWTVFKNKKEMPGFAGDIGEAMVNAAGNVAAVSVKLFNGRSQVWLISDEYYEPQKGREYNVISEMMLHPYLGLVVYKAVRDGATFVVQNTAEYAGGAVETGKPQYSFDGKDVFFAGQDGSDSFININGNKTPLKNQLSASGKYAFAPGRKNLAFASSTTLVVQNFEKETLRAGFMVDELISPRYNRFLKRYETLGRINQRLYMIICPS